MRNLIALFVCCLAMSSASADAPPAAAAPAPAATAAAPAPAATAAAPAKPVVPSIKPSIKPALAPRLSPAAQLAQEEQAEVEAEAALSAKIAERLAAMRANQAARVAAAARAKKAKDEKRRVEAAATVVAAKPRNGTVWSYEGELGPANWANINTQWAACGTGKRQSPIDIRNGMRVDLEQIVFDYKPAPFSVLDNGKTIEVTVSGGNFISVMNNSYELMHFHFHRPSEERINGRGTEMVMHLVHKDVYGKLAVLAVLLERGKENGLIQTVWNNLPLEKHDAVQPSVMLDLADALPENRDYYTFMGSMTTPPCTEDVLWMVMKTPMQASPAQMALFSRLYPFNARPIQPHSGRMIKESN
jgi:carbonic anhydrase